MVVYYKKTLRDKNIRVESGPGIGVWVSVTAPTEEEIAKLARQFLVSEPLLKASLDEDEIARIETEDQNKLFIFKLPYEEQGEIETIPLGVIITPDKTITVCLKEHPLIADFTTGKVKAFHTTTKTKFLLQIIKRINVYFLSHLSLIEKKAEELEQRLHQSVANREIIKLMELQNTLLYFSKATAANNTIIERMIKGSVVQLYEEDKDLLEDISFDSKQAIEMVGIYSGILASTMDAYASIVSNNLNIVMKFLAAVTIIFSMPVMVASFYGMNVSLPLQNHPASFLITLLISAALMFITGYIFALKKFL